MIRQIQASNPGTTRDGRASRFLRVIKMAVGLSILESKSRGSWQCGGAGFPPTPFS